MENKAIEQTTRMLQGMEEDLHFLRLELNRFFPMDGLSHLGFLEQVYKVKDTLDELSNLADELQEKKEEKQRVLVLIDDERYRGM
jgi:Fe-S oxidoreductase